MVMVVWPIGTVPAKHYYTHLVLNDLVSSMTETTKLSPTNVVWSDAILTGTSTTADEIKQPIDYQQALNSEMVKPRMPTPCSPLRHMLVVLIRKE